MNDQGKRLFGLGLLLEISKRVREAGTPEEIGFLAVNETKQLIDYGQAALWLRSKGIFAISGLPEPDINDPYVQWLSAAFRELSKDVRCRKIKPSDLPAKLVKLGRTGFRSTQLRAAYRGEG